MKRANESVDEDGENLNSKKGRILSKIDENSNGSDTVENRGIESESEDTIIACNGHMSPDGTKDLSIKCDSEEKPNPLNFDLNFPVWGEDAGDRLEMGCSTSAQHGELISIASNNRENQVDATATGECEVKELFICGLGRVGVSNETDESNLMMTDEKRTSLLDILAETALNLSKLKDAHPSDLSLRPFGAKLMSSDESTEHGEAAMARPEAAAPPRIASIERARRAAEERSQRRLQIRRQTAEGLARGNIPVRRTLNEVPGENQPPPPTSGDAGLLGTSPGPFSEAFKLVQKRAPEQLIEWTPHSQENVRKITIVPSLLNLSLKALAENAEGIVSLECVPSFLCRRLIDILCDNRKMNLDIFNLLLEPSSAEIRVKNCSWIDDQQFQKLFGRFQAKSLRVLQLDLCGQCMLDYTFWDAVQSANRFLNLAIVSLRGACRLSDDGLKYLIKSAPELQSIDVGQCCLLTSDSIIFLANSLGANLRELYIDECLKIDATRILPAFKNLTSLEVLSLARLQTVTDSFVSGIVTICGHNIKELDLADCLELTDDAFKTIGAGCANLHALNISNAKVTDLVLEYLANGCRSIQKLKLCRNKFSDEAMAAFLECSGKSLLELSLNRVTKVGPQTALSLATRSRKLSILDLSWCRKITNVSLGLIVNSCSSLKLLKIFGCRQITESSLDWRSNKNVRIIGNKSTLLLDHIDDVLEHRDVFLHYSPLPEVAGDN